MSYTGFTWPYIWPKVIICVFGILTNTINIFVFANPKLSSASYRCMLINSITNLSYLTINLMAVFFYLCNTCQSSTTYFAALFSILVFFYFSSCLAVFRIMIEIVLSLYTYCILTNRAAWIERVALKRLVYVLFVASLIIYGHQPFAYQINQRATRFTQGDNDVKVVYTVKASEFGNSVIGKMCAIFQASIRIFLILVVLTFLNLLNLVSFRKRYENRLNNGK